MAWGLKTLAVTVGWPGSNSSSNQPPVAPPYASISFLASTEDLREADGLLTVQHQPYDFHQWFTTSAA